MNVSLAQKLSIYQLAWGVRPSPSPLHLSAATLLSMLRSQIDLLIEQQISATLWVKLPPGKIWYSEIQRYQQVFAQASLIYTCPVVDNGRIEETKKLPPSSSFVRFLPHHPIRREYFLMVLSPQFCSLTVAHRKLKNYKNKKLLTITTVEGRIIQQVLDGLQKATLAESSMQILADFVCPATPDPLLMSRLLTKQFQRQEEINHQITTKQTTKVEKQIQNLHNTLQFKDEFLSSVCQEMRAPLTHMKTALSLLNSPTLKTPQRQRYLQMLSAHCDRQASLINGVLELMQIERSLEATSLESIHLADIVPGVVSTYQPLAQEKGIMLAYTVPAELPPVWCVSGGLKQIVIHLLSNSIKFTPNGGQVWVRGRVQDDYVLLEFRDTGIGIAETDILKIFDRFYRVRPVSSEDQSGAGLGLTIVQQLLERCGGSLSVKSKLGEGSVFTVQLAIANDKTHENSK